MCDDAGGKGLSTCIEISGYNSLGARFSGGCVYPRDLDGFEQCTHSHVPPSALLLTSGSAVTFLNFNSLPEDRSRLFLKLTFPPVNQSCTRGPSTFILTPCFVELNSITRQIRASCKGGIYLVSPPLYSGVDYLNEERTADQLKSMRILISIFSSIIIITI